MFKQMDFQTGYEGKERVYAESKIRLYLQRFKRKD